MVAGLRACAHINDGKIKRAKKMKLAYFMLWSPSAGPSFKTLGRYVQVDLYSLRGHKSDSVDEFETGFQQLVFGHDLVHQTDPQRFLGIDVIAGQRIAKGVFETR